MINATSSTATKKPNQFEDGFKWPDPNVDYFMYKELKLRKKIVQETIDEQQKESKKLFNRLAPSL